MVTIGLGIACKRFGVQTIIWCLEVAVDHKSGARHYPSK